jgi:hypothetical protein
VRDLHEETPDEQDCGVGHRRPDDRLRAGRGEWFVAIAFVTGLVWILLNAAGLDAWGGWAAYPDRRPLLGRKIHGRSSAIWGSSSKSMRTPRDP